MDEPPLQPRSQQTPYQCVQHVPIVIFLKFLLNSYSFLQELQLVVLCPQALQPDRDVHAVCLRALPLLDRDSKQPSPSRKELLSNSPPTRDLRTPAAAQSPTLCRHPGFQQTCQESWKNHRKVLPWRKSDATHRLSENKLWHSQPPSLPQQGFWKLP